MATWAIGDVHGCYRTLRALLERIGLDRKRDRLWFVGDLVNRGARSLEVLRYVCDLGDRATTVLGNHDLHCLARAAGVAPSRKHDSLEALLEAPDRHVLLEWLRGRPLVVEAEGRLLLHAGVLRDWSRDDVVLEAVTAESALRHGDWVALLALYRPSVEIGPETPAPMRRVLEALRVLTLLRVTTPAGRPRYDFTGPPDEAPRNRVPWFELPRRRTARVPIVCGHWAAAGLVRRRNLVALDTGCAWGGALTAARLEDGRVEQVANAES